MSDYALEFCNVNKSYSTKHSVVHALCDMTFRVKKGMIHVLLGPNGAGKTTALESAIGLRTPDSGQIYTLGLNPLHNKTELCERVSIQPQEASMFEYLRVGEVLDMWESLYKNSHSVHEIVEALDLSSLLDRQVIKMSGGQKQRLNVALAMVSRPELLFLDEPSTGLDPRARENLWHLLKNWRESGTTVVVSTHMMDEAHALADTVMIVDHGTCVVHDTPAELIERYAGQSSITFYIPVNKRGELQERLNNVGQLAFDEEGKGHLTTSDTDQALNCLMGSGFVTNVGVQTTTLADVYKATTGVDFYPERGDENAK